MTSLALLVLVLFFAAPSFGNVVCDYCKYCDYCGYCVDCPCENNKHNKHCELCVYCKYCSICGVCDVMCKEDSWLQTTYRNFFGDEAADTKQPPNGAPTPQEVENLLSQRGIDLNTLPKKREAEKKEL